jgi:hypothetical protein
MIAYGDAEGTENVANQQQAQVDGSDETAPEAVNGKSGSQKGNPDYKLENNLVARGNRFIGHKLELYPRRSWMQGRDTLGGYPRAGVLGMGMGMGMGIGSRESVVRKRENSINTNSEYEREALRYWKWGNVPEKTRNEFHAKDATIAKKGSSILCFYW